MAGPEFGPGGYLPPKAAKRARKIVLREQMGWGWPLAAVGAALLVAVAGGIFLLTAKEPPQAPYVELAFLAELEGPVYVGGAGGLPTVLVVRAGGAIRTFRAPPGDPTWCDQSRRVETASAAWTSNGAVVFGDQPSLTPLRSVVYDGTIYVDPTNPLPPPAAAPDGVPPVCKAA